MYTFKLVRVIIYSRRILKFLLFFFKVINFVTLTGSLICVDLTFLQVLIDCISVV